MRTPRSSKFNVPLVRVNWGMPASVSVLFWNARAPVTLTSAACASGISRPRSSFALPCASAPSVTPPIQPFTGLAFTYRTISANGPLAVPRTSSVAS